MGAYISRLGAAVGATVGAISRGFGVGIGLGDGPGKGEPESLRIRNGSIPSKNGKRVARVWVRIPGLAA